MNIYQYTALNNPDGSMKVVESYGIQALRNPKQLGKQLAMIVAKNGDEALNKVASIHPDLPLFQKQIDDFKAKIKKESESNSMNNFSNFVDGQSLKNDISSIKDKMYSADGSSTANIEASHRTKSELLIIGGVIVIGLAIIFKNK